jgi:hypothetical protein
MSFLRRTQDMSERSEESHPLLLEKLLVKQVEWDSSPAAQTCPECAEGMTLLDSVLAMRDQYTAICFVCYERGG